MTHVVCHFRKTNHRRYLGYNFEPKSRIIFWTHKSRVHMLVFIPSICQNPKDVHSRNLVQIFRKILILSKISKLKRGAFEPGFRNQTSERCSRKSMPFIWLEKKSLLCSTIDIIIYHLIQKKATEAKPAHDGSGGNFLSLWLLRKAL